MTVDTIKIHHEGGGKPHDDPGVSGTKGYGYWNGPTRWTFLRPPWLDFSTFNLNHVVTSVCFSGQRHEGIPNDPAHPVTDKEIQNLREIAAHARANHYLIDIPRVSPHDNLYGSATACPGSLVYKRWPEIVDACTIPHLPIPAPEDDDMESYPYPHSKVTNKFSGIVVDRANKRIAVYGDAKIDQPTIGPFWGPPNPNPILTSFKGTRGANGVINDDGVTIVTSDSDEYKVLWR